MPALEHAIQVSDQASHSKATTRPIRPPLRELAGAVSRDFSIRTSHEELTDFYRICHREIAKLAQEWVPIGQAKTVPKRLTENVRYFYRDYVIFAWNSQPDAASEVRFLLRTIRNAIDQIKKVSHDRATSTDRDKPLYKKTVTFLKRLAHDRSFNESVGGARKYRDYVIKTKLKARLTRPICDEQVNDLGQSWQVNRVRSQQDLLDIGKTLSLCVAKKNEMTRRYFRALVTRKSEFWEIRADDQSKGLFEVHCDSHYTDCSSLKSYRRIGEFNGHSHSFLQLPYQIAAALVRKLKVHSLSSAPLFNAGAFPSFVLGSKDRARPDFSIMVGIFRYEVWCAQYELIISRMRTITDGYPATEMSSEWWYFFRGSNDVSLDHPDEADVVITEIPPRRFETTPQDLRPHHFSAVSVEEALTVLTLQLISGSSQVRPAATTNASVAGSLALSLNA